MLCSLKTRFIGCVPPVLRAAGRVTRNRQCVFGRYSPSTGGVLSVSVDADLREKANMSFMASHHA